MTYWWERLDPKYDGYRLRWYWLRTSDRTRGLGTWVPHCDWLDAMGRYQ